VETFWRGCSPQPRYNPLQRSERQQQRRGVKASAYRGCLIVVLERHGEDGRAVALRTSLAAADLARQLCGSQLSQLTSLSQRREHVPSRVGRSREHGADCTCQPVMSSEGLSSVRMHAIAAGLAS
jgi:hypothetical protein